MHAYILMDSYFTSPKPNMVTIMEVWKEIINPD